MAFEDQEEQDRPLYVISVVAKIVGVHAQTLRYYERAGLLKPSRSPGQIRLFSPRDVERIRQIKTMMEDLGVNLAGVEVILRLTERMAQMDQQLQAVTQELLQLRRGKNPEQEGDKDETGEIH